MTIANNLPSPTAPFLDANGNISQVWWQYLLTLFNRTGAGKGIDSALLQNLITALQMQENEGKSDATGFLLRRIADLEMQIEAMANPSVLPQGFANVTIAGVPRRIATY